MYIQKKNVFKFAVIPALVLGVVSATQAGTCTSPCTVAGIEPALALNNTSGSERFWVAETITSGLFFQIGIKLNLDDTSYPTPFRIELGAEDNLLYLDDDEHVGINKANPDETLEIASYQPGIRLNDSDGGQVDLEMTGHSFKIEGDAGSAFINAETTAPHNSIYIDSTGKIGLGAANPIRDLHVGGSGDVHLENGDSDWLLYTDISGFSLYNFDGSHTRTLLVGANAPSNSLVVEGTTGDLGIGILNPIADLHIRGEGIGTSEELLRLESATKPQIKMMNTSTGRNWILGMNAQDDLILYANETGKTAAKFRGNGNLIIAGNLTENSDRDSKRAIKPVDSKQILSAVTKLPISTWEYKREEGVTHLGPMAQDFHTAFGLGDDPKGISSIDTGGVALAAIKGLNEGLEEVVESNQSKDKEIESLKERLTMLENLVNKMTAKEVVMNP